MRLQIVTPPAAEPVTTAEATSQVNGYGTTHDVLLARLIKVATQNLDGPKGRLARALMPQTWDLKLDGFPCWSQEIEIPLPPLRSITLISYVDSDGFTQTLATSVYAVDIASDPGVVSLKYGQTWPATRAERNAVTIRFVAGYATAAAVPDPLKQAILLHVAGLFENRERGIVGATYIESPAFENLIFPFQMLRV